jgi:hypothetical protein
VDGEAVLRTKALIRQCEARSGGRVQAAALSLFGAVDAGRDCMQETTGETWQAFSVKPRNVGNLALAHRTLRAAASRRAAQPYMYLSYRG